VFLAYDRYIKLWDTETGQCVSRFTSRKIPYCAKFHPEESKQHFFVAGTSDKKIICVSHGNILVIARCIKLFLFYVCKILFLLECPVSFQWDVRSGEIVQEYDRHLGAVNTITFVDENRRFVTTSDDKSLRVWEW
jgi:pre-mRNA-processing factor 17